LIHFYKRPNEYYTHIYILYKNVWKSAKKLTFGNRRFLQFS